MKPSSALGTFLRYWRSEWAGLSRAQLALAVAAQCRRKRVTEAMVRAWERGQPPADTEELDALLAVMRRHGLNEPEIGHVRHAIFAACLDRHYPELFPEDDFAEQPDVDQMAGREYDHWPWSSTTDDVVKLAGELESLERTVGRDFEPAQPDSQRRRQQVALAFARQSMCHYCEATARYGLAARHAVVNERFVADCFGPAGTCRNLNATNQRIRVLSLAGLAAESTAPVPELLSLSHDAEARDDPTAAAAAFMTAFALIPAPGFGAMREALWPDVDRHLDSVGVDPGYVALVISGAVADGEWARAEACASAMAPLEDGSEPIRGGWHGKMGEFAYGRGDLSEAEEHFAECLRVADMEGVTYHQAMMPRLLRMCEEARRHPRQDRMELWAAAGRAAKTELRPRRRWSGPPQR